MTQKKLAVIVLGKSNSGKSSTWYEIFGRTVRTGRKHLVLFNIATDVYLRNSSYEETGREIEQDVYLRNASFEESGQEIEVKFKYLELPNIVFCSVQYIEQGIRTINWFKDNGYYLYIQWLNPGYFYSREYKDFLNFEEHFAPYGKFTRHTGDEIPVRAKEIKQFLVSWICEKVNP